MRSIPTDLLRAFIAVIDLRGYTRAGERLGRTQPAISLQMKKLQDLLEARLFVKDGSDGQLTEAGEIVASYARQILALNDSTIAAALDAWRAAQTASVAESPVSAV